MNLAQEIKQYYFEHINELPEDKRFHFASRIAAWQGDPEALKQLSELKNYMLPTDIAQVFNRILNKPPGKIYGKELRENYLHKYPKLFGIHNALFRIRHLKEIYGVDARKDLLNLVGQKELEKLYKDLTNDSQALRILSRFAVDYIYLYEILYGANERFDPQSILALKGGYDLKDKTQLHLFIYLYTHSIIADSNFYARQIPAHRLSVYRNMLNELESLIDGRSDIKLDNKFEVLVASRICGREADLGAEINKQAHRSLNAHGRFIIDKLNGNEEAKFNSLVGSEHRNVLFIMSSSPFSPHSTLIT